MPPLGINDTAVGDTAAAIATVGATAIAAPAITIASAAAIAAPDSGSWCQS